MLSSKLIMWVCHTICPLNSTLTQPISQVGWIVCGSFTAVAAVASFWLINKHLQWYTNKREQRYIVRLLFLVPIYALISFASFLFWNNATPLILVRDAYEAIVLTAFFYLLLVYLSPDPEEQKRIFLKAGLSKANDQDGLYFLQLMKWGVLQYCVIRPLTTLIAVILDYAGYYCESSWSPVWGHVWIVIIISISVTIAMYCLIQLYLPVSKELKPHRPILKLFSVKAVVFLTFWQATLLSGLSMLGVVKDTKYMTAEDINIGIGAILECFEMMIFAFVHIKAFTYKPYRPFHNPASKDPPPRRTPRFRSLGHALDFRETFREIWIGCVYMFDKMRGREPSPDFSARRAAHYERAFGQSRPSQIEPKAAVEGGVKKAKSKPQLSPSNDITVNQQVEVDVSGERQWLGLGDDYGYGLGYFRRERSEGLSVQIEKELQQRGYGADYNNRSDSLLNRIFPPSEVGSFEGRSRVETDSAYSLPHAHAEGTLGQPRATPSGRLVLSSSPRSSTSEFGFTGDRRQHVHEQVYHPSASTYALHTPWTADILHHPGSAHASQASDINNEYGEPPPLPEKDLNYVPSFRRPHRRDPAHARHRPPVDSAASLPSLPEDVQFTAPLPPWLASQNDTERSSTLVDTPTSPQSAYFSDNRSSYAESQWSSPPTPHAKPVRRKPSDISVHPSPSGAATLSSMTPYEHEQQQQSSKPRRGAAMLTPSSLSPAPRHHAADNTRNSSVVEMMDDVTPSRARDPLRSRQPVDSDDDISVSTFYTAASQPRSARARR
ncbi:hypothetical protein MD484_g4124, partial [Candolleomyces efflorescens]